MNKRKQVRGLALAIVVTVGAAMIAVSAMLLRDSGPTYALANNAVCPSGYRWNDQAQTCIQTKPITKQNCYCENGQGGCSQSDLSQYRGWVKADSNIYGSEFAVKYAANMREVPGQLQTDKYTDLGVLCSNIKQWRGVSQRVEVYTSFYLVKTANPVTKEPEGTLTRSQCLAQASKSNTKATGDGIFIHCMRYECKNGNCTPYMETNNTQVLCANGNTRKYYWSVPDSGTCASFEQTNENATGTFYCTSATGYDCDHTVDGYEYVKKAQTYVSPQLVNCFKDTSNANKVGENVVKHCETATFNGSVWTDVTTTNTGAPLGCPEGYVREDYDKILMGSTGDCNSAHGVRTDGTNYAEGSKRACITTYHYKCVPDKEYVDKDILNSLDKEEIAVTDLTSRDIKVNDEFYIYVNVPVTNYNLYDIRLASTDRSIINQAWEQYKKRGDDSTVVIPLKAFQAGKVTLTVSVGNHKFEQELKVRDIYEGTDTSYKSAPTCQITLVEDTPAESWSNMKRLRVDLTNSVPLADRNAYIWSDGRSESIRGVTSKKNYSVTVTGINGKTGTCEISASALGKLDSKAPSISNTKVNSNGQITFTASDSESGIDSWYIKLLGETVRLGEDGAQYTTVESGSMSVNNVRRYGSKFTCDSDKRCEVSHNVGEAGTYMIYVVDKAGNMYKTKQTVNQPDSPYLDDLYVMEPELEGQLSLLTPTKTYGTLTRLANTYQTASTAKQNNLDFNKNKMDYTYTTTSSVITFYATLTSGDKKFVEGYDVPKNQKLEYGANVFTIKVEDKKGKVRAYTITVIRDDNRSGVNLLSSLTVGSQSIDFLETTTDYDVNVLKGTTSISINATLKSNSSDFVENYGPRIVDLTEDGMTAEIKVQSEAGSVRVYKITFHFVEKEEDIEKPSTGSSAKPATTTKGSSYLASLGVSDTNITFSKERLNYNVYVPYTTVSVTVYAFAEDPNAKVVVNTPQTLRVGENTATVSVTSTSKQTRTYTITIIRKEDSLGISSNTRLGSFDVLGYDIGFKADKTNYELKIKEEQNLFILATPESDRSEVYIVGNEDLSTFSTIKVSVIAEDGSEDVYSLAIKKDAWNTRKEVIIAAIGLTIAIGATVVIQVRRKKKRKSVQAD